MWSGSTIRLMKKETNKMEHFHKIGILTFQWADNYGAMLQAYGLKTWLARQMYDPFIINYAPVRLRGRDWLVPYAPLKTVSNRLMFAMERFVPNILTGNGWFLQKRNMRQFREDYLIADHKVLADFGYCRILMQTHWLSAATKSGTLILRLAFFPHIFARLRMPE